jgi:SAM-dependent methyltransferase
MSEIGASSDSLVDQDDVSEGVLDLAEKVLYSCGGRRILHLGCRNGLLVRTLLRFGVDAYGFDLQSDELVGATAMAPGRFYSGALEKLPFSVGAFDTVIVTGSLDELADEVVDALFVELLRVAGKAVYLCLRLGERAATDLSHTGRTRAWWELKSFAAGFRKHPAYYQVNAYETLQFDGKEITILLEPLPGQALALYPIERLRQERDLHMDMLRETGARSDAHVARYQWAASFVRPGDTVLDAACGLGYGSYLLQIGSPAARTLGIDGSAFAVEYARESFASRLPALSFQEGFLPKALTLIPDCSVDFIVSFETLEHVEENRTLLAEFYRILTPAGRIVASVPNDWSDETGKDPNPFHLHVYSLDTLRGQLKEHFILENMVAQSASRHKQGAGRKVWAEAGRLLREVAVDIPEAEAPDAEWWLAVAMRSPNDGEHVPYRESVFPVFESPEWNVTAFERDYRNAWLIRGMVHVHHRLKCRDALAELAEAVIDRGDCASPDVGAALCVRAYQLLEAPGTTADEVGRLSERIDAYLATPPQTPHGVRWSISLLFAVGRLSMEAGDFVGAVVAFERCVAIDPLQYSPLLCNRAVEARLLLGLIAFVAGDTHTAAEHWKSGLKQAQRAVDVDWASALGDAFHPVDFGLPELASILEYASSCAQALARIDEFELKGGWWRHPFRNRIADSARQSRRLESVGKANDWLSSQRNAWEMRARSLDSSCLELADSSEALHRDKAWLTSQRDAWEAKTRDSVERIKLLEGALEKSNQDSAWLESQKNAWEAKARAVDERILLLEAALEESKEGAAWLEAQRDAWQALSVKYEARITADSVALEGLKRSNDVLRVQSETAELRVIGLESRCNELLTGLDRAQIRDIGSMERIAVLEKALIDLQAAIDWNASQRGVWEQKASESDDRLRAMTKVLDERDDAIRWLGTQRDAWEKSAGEANAQIEALKERLEVQLVHSEALGSQVKTLESRVFECELRIEEKSKIISSYELCLEGIRSSAAMRLVNSVFRNRFF